MATDLDDRKDARPLEPVLLEREDWFRCPSCRRAFAAAEGLRSHHRFGRCPSSLDPLDEAGLSEEELRLRVRRRLRNLGGIP